MDSDKNVTVEFELIPATQYDLTASVTGGNGTVTPTSGTYDQGTIVTLTATPDAGYRVLTWGGTDDDASTLNTNAVTMDSDKNVTVEFEPLQVPENILLNPGFEDGENPWKFYTNGEGSFTVSSPAYDGFGAAFITTVTAGTNIQFYQYNFVLEPNTDYQLSFAAYSNTGHDMSVAIFQHLLPYTNYGLRHSEVNLTMSWNVYTIDFTTSNFSAPVDDARLMFWFADDATAGDQYWIDSVVLSKVGSSVQYNLTASVTGGNGTVTPTSGTYDQGTIVTLTATPDAGYRVLTWGGTDDDASTLNTNAVTMDSDKNVTVEFELIPDSGILSDDFNACILDPMWTLVDPIGDATVLMQGAGTGDAQLLFSVPAGASHDAWNLNTAPVLLQPANNADFTVQVKFDSSVEEEFQSQGIIIQEDSNNWLRFDFYSNGQGMRIFAAITVNGSSSSMIDQSITPGAPMYMRVERAGDDWTQSYSYDGVNWTVAVSFTHQIAVTKVGLFVGNFKADDNAPAHTAVIDYFFNIASPIVPEDGGPVPETEQELVVTVTGFGTVTVDPELEIYGCGDVLQLTASPDAGYRVLSWSGTDDDTLTTNINTVTMDSDKSVTVEFELIPAQYTLTMAVSGNGSTIPSVGDLDYAEDEVVTVSAVSYGDWQFDSWTGDVADPYSATTTVSMDTDKIVTATFTQSDVIYTEDFEAYAADENPFDWFDSAVNNSMLEDDSLFKVFDLSGNKAFGTTSTLTNIHSHYMGAGIDALSSYEYTGRMRMTSATSGIGVTFFSQYPQADAYYRLRHTDNSYHISSHGTSITGGTTDTGIVPLPNVWYRFKIQVVDVVDTTRTVIRAKVWQDATAEPSAWQVVAYDDSATRLTSGRIGVWSSSSDIKYWDELVVDFWSPGINEPSFVNIWYGPEQTFGHIGIPQRWVNILGNVSDPDGVESLTYWLNDGSEFLLTIGPTDRRLDEEGDFNIEIAIEDLDPNQNELVILAIDIYGNETFESVTVNYESGNVWPESYTIDWSSASSIQSVAQIVDGLWTLEANSIRPLQLGYDRLVAIGDVTWDNYEVTVPITIHGIEEIYGPPGGGPYLGLIVRWQGHTEDGIQPSEQWWPLGVFGTYTWRESYERFELLDYGYTIVDTSGLQLEFEVEYIFKLRVETVIDGSLYSLKVWPADQLEPSEWTMVGFEDLSFDQTHGSVLLVAQFVDASFGTVTIVPLD